MPAGDELTVPLPVTLTARLCVAEAKLAVTLRAAEMLSVQVVEVPAHEPLQPVKLAPALGVAVNVTDVPWLKLLEQLLPQLIPLGVDVTVP